MTGTKPMASDQVEATRARNNTLPGKAGPERDVIMAVAEDVDAVERLKAIMDGLAESVLEMSDEEILEEMRMQKRDPIQEAEQTRKVLIEALKGEARKAERSPKPFTQ